MAGIPQYFIDEILARSDIIDVVGSRVPLKKAGKEYKACCPFHDEKSPSFTVSFVMAYDHLGFVEAIEELAGRLGLEVPRDNTYSKKNQQAKSLHDLMESISHAYQEHLKRDTTAIDYLKGRGLSGKVAADFRVGSVADKWDTILNKFGETSEQKAQLKLAGMLSENEQGRTYDRFRGRIMFPIRDSRGRVIAFGGRVLNSEDNKSFMVCMKLSKRIDI